MLDISLHDGARSFSFVLAGALTRPWTEELDHAWRTATSILNGKQFVVNLVRIREVDDDGVRLLKLMSENGARLITASDSIDAVARIVSGREPVDLPVPPGGVWRRLLCRFRCCWKYLQSRLESRHQCSPPQQKFW